jgi:hypothetical protein
VGILDFISGILSPISAIISNLHTSDGEKMQLQNEMQNLQNQMAAKLLDYESKLLSAQTDVVKAEANGASFIQRSWRPITMLVLLALVVCDSFGWLHNPLSHDAWLLIQLGMSGYIGSRGLEKIVPHVASIIKESKD